MHEKLNLESRIKIFIDQSHNAKTQISDMTERLKVLMEKINEHENLTMKFVHSSQNLESLFGTAQASQCKNGVGFNKHMLLSPLSKTPLRKYNDHFV